jgi:lysophospholipase L1-like esterase
MEPRGGNGLKSPAAGAMATLLVLLIIPYLVPALRRVRVLTPLAEGEGLTLVTPAEQDAPVGEAELPAASEGSDRAQPERAVMPPEAKDIVARTAEQERPPRSIEDPSGRALDAFFRALDAVERGERGAIARVSYWGDSNVASDFVTATLRRRLQRRFGDAGHGFVLLANSDPYYFHNDVVRSASFDWGLTRISGPLSADGMYGIGGASFRSKAGGAFSRTGTARTGAFGLAVSRFSIDYLEHPQGERMEVRIDGQLREIVDTRADVTRGVFRTYEVPDGPHEIELRPLGAGVRAFGVALERDTPGVVVDALGVAGSKVRYLSRIDRAHWEEQLKLRSPALAVFHFGVNEGTEGDLTFPLDQYEATMGDAIAAVRRALPGSSCLLVSPNDLAWKTTSGAIASKAVVPKLAAIQRRVAAAQGCAFWDLFEAMGGSGSMARWIHRGLGNKDMMHPSTTGAEVLGHWLYLALMEAYAAGLEKKRE